MAAAVLDSRRRHLHRDRRPPLHRRPVRRAGGHRPGRGLAARPASVGVHRSGARPRGRLPVWPVPWAPSRLARSSSRSSPRAVRAVRCCSTWIRTSARWCAPRSAPPEAVPVKPSRCATSCRTCPTGGPSSRMCRSGSTCGKTVWRTSAPTAGRHDPPRRFRGARAVSAGSSTTTRTASSRRCSWRSSKWSRGGRRAHRGRRPAGRLRHVRRPAPRLADALPGDRGGHQNRYRPLPADRRRPIALSGRRESNPHHQLGRLGLYH